MDKLGKLVREKRTKKGETIKQLARALKCSESFVKHIESSRIVPVSDRLVMGLKRHYRFPNSIIEKAVTSRNKVGRAYFKNYRKAV